MCHSHALIGGHHCADCGDMKIELIWNHIFGFLKENKMRIAVGAVVLLVTLIGIIVYMAQAIQPEIETTVEIIPSEKLNK